MSGEMCQTSGYPGGLNEALQSTPCILDTFCVCYREVTTYIESQQAGKSDKGTKAKHFPPLPFSQENALETMLKRGPPLWLAFVAGGIV